MTLSDTPVYNLKAVLRETGIKADVLRAWERRYGLPKPNRTSGGHRLYSQHDIEMIKWLIARQNEGLSISRAVELWREIESESRDPLAELRQSAIPAQMGFAVPESNMDTMRAQWLSACMAFNENAAEQVLNQAFAIYPVDMVIADVIQRGMNEVGEMWYRGEATVQQEHFTSALAMRRLETLITATPRPTRNQTVLTACPAEEWHTFAMLLLNLMLRRRGLNVVYLGGNVPIERMGDAVDSIRPNLVILSAQHMTSANSLQKTATLLRDKGTQVAYGGGIFNRVSSLRERIPAHFLGESIEASIQTIEQLLYNPRPLPFVADTPAHYRSVVQEFKEKRGLIESALAEELRAHGMEMVNIDVANQHLGNQLTAALELGDASFMAADMEWVRNMMAQQKVPVDRLTPYLIAYGHAVRQTMSGNPTAITNWIDTYVLQQIRQN